MSGEQQVKALMELEKQRMDGLRMIRMLPSQAEIISDPHSELLIAGGNRGSKTVCAAVMIASIARDVPVQTMDGDMINCRLPHQKNRPLTIWAVGDYLKHIGQVIHRVLFRAGLYWIIRDEVTGGWRSWNPVHFPNDWNRLDERKPSMPLIPNSEIDWDNTAWYHKGLRQFEKIALKNGTEIYAFASASEKQQGVPVDVGWFDEHLVDERWYTEMQTRLTDNRGRLIWSTIPRDESPTFISVAERAEQQADEVAEGTRKPEKLFTKHFKLSLTDNPFLPEDEKEKRFEQLSERDRLVRISGELSTNVIRIYQTFNPSVHCVKYRDPLVNDQVTKELDANNWEPPDDWCRYLALDPGTQKPAVLFMAIPPEHMWDEKEPYFIAYDELYIPRLDAFQIAGVIKERHFGHFFEEFFIDGQAARQKPMGFSWNIGHQYEKAFAEEGLRSRHGSYFTPGDPDFMQRSGLLHKAMRMRKCGRPQFRIIGHKCPHLTKQLLTNTRKLDKQGEPLEVPADHQKDDLRVCLEYFVSRHPTYKEPPIGSKPDDPTMKRYHQYREEMMRKGYGKKPTDGSVLCGAAG